MSHPLCKVNVNTLPPVSWASVPEAKLLDYVERARESLDRALLALDVPSMSSADARAVLLCAAEVERRASAVKVLVAARAIADEGWAGEGARSAEDWLSRKTGSSYGEAKETLEASEKTESVPLFGDAVREGSLSGEQTRQVGSAATVKNSLTMRA